MGGASSGYSYFCRSAARTPRFSRSDPGPRALPQEGCVLRNILIVVYLVIGVVVTKLLAVLLWPLILFGVSLHIK